VELRERVGWSGVCEGHEDHIGDSVGGSVSDRGVSDVRGCWSSEDMSGSDVERGDA